MPQTMPTITVGLCTLSGAAMASQARAGQGDFAMADTLGSLAKSICQSTTSHFIGMETSWRSRAKSSLPVLLQARSHTPSMSPHLPITAQEIADAAIGAAEAGAAIVHLHARNPQDGRPDQTPEAFSPFLKVIKQRSERGGDMTTAPLQ